MIRDFLFSSHLDDDDEEILYVAHRSAWVLKFSAFKSTFFGVFMPSAVYLLFPQLLLLCMIWLGCGLIGVLYHFIDWYFDALVITNKGVIDIERNGLFDRNSTRVDYHMIEGIAYAVKGVMQTIFNYGDLTVDKLGTQTSLVLRDCAKPKKIERIILKNQEKFVNSRSMRDHNVLKDMLAEMIAYHVHSEKVKLKD